MTLKAVKVSKGTWGKECAGSITVGELTVHCFCAALVVVTGALLCQFNSERKGTGAGRV